MKYLKDLVFTDVSEVAEFAYKKAYDLEDIGCVQVVGFYEEISDVLKEILQYDEVSVGNIELNSDDWNGYLKEYYLTIDEDMVVCVEPGYYAEKEIYLQYEAETLIICDDCNSVIIKNNMHEGAESYCYRYDDDCDCGCCDCCECDNDSQTGESTYVSRNSDGRVTGFSKSWSDMTDGVSYYSSYSHYSDNEESVRKVAKEFGIDL